MLIIIITGVLITARVRTLCISLHCIISMQYMCICFLLLLNISISLFTHTCMALQGLIKVKGDN